MDHIILEYLRDKELTQEEAIEIIEWYLEYKKKKKETAQKYYQENREKLDTYHEKYRRTRPDYRKKATDRIKKYRRK